MGEGRAMEIGLSVEMFVCDACEEQGVTSTALVRMMPKAAVMNGKLVGNEFWGCPHCLTLHFPISAEAKKSWRKPERASAPRRMPERPALKLVKGEGK